MSVDQHEHPDTDARLDAAITGARQDLIAIVEQWQKAGESVERLLFLMRTTPLHAGRYAKERTDGERGRRKTKQIEAQRIRIFELETVVADLERQLKDKIWQGTGVRT